MIRVLVADDHALVREGLKSLLSGASDIAVVGEVANGKEAIRAAIELKPDVVLLDVSMPVLNGMEALRLIRREIPEIKVIMVSMHSTAQHVYQALAAGAAGYVAKDAASEDIVSAIRAAHAGQLSLPTHLLATGNAHLERSPLETLSARERQVMQLVVEGKSSGDISRLLHLSRKSVDTYRSRLMKKLGVSDIVGLVKFAVAHGITPPM
jgi:DNA-binding NarL/FixJ family response regulator